MEETPDILMNKKRARALLWHKGVLSWKLTPVQKDLYNSFFEVKRKTIVWECSRRIGKSYALCLLSVEKCIQQPNAIIKFIAPNQKHVKTIIKPILKEILSDCPKELAPKFRAAENIYEFPNGSEIQLAGTDNGHAESLRGGSAHICIIDEAGFCDDLKYIIQSILIPTTTTTHGKIILSSTPPKTMDHQFCDYATQAKYKNSYIKKTIFDAMNGNGPITEEAFLEIVEEYGGVDNPDFKREYLCESIRDEEYTVIPEFDEKTEKLIVKEVPKPPFFDAYVGGDIGFKDFTVMLFGYYDFKNAQIVIEDELVMRGHTMDTEKLANELKQKEKNLWTNPMTRELKEPYLRVCDNNLIVINDLYKLHGLTFQPTAKDSAEAALNQLKIAIKQGKIIIHPRCKTLIFHLREATWAKNKKTYARSADSGHYDAIDALKYFVRNVQFNKNPYPANYGMGNGNDWWQSDSHAKLAPALQSLKDIFVKPKKNKGFNKY